MNRDPGTEYLHPSFDAASTHHLPRTTPLSRQSFRQRPFESAAEDDREIGTSTKAEVYLDRLRHNAEVFRSVCGEADLMAVVKADAYGHGATRTTQTLTEAGIRWFGVATPAEGIALRRTGLDARIVVFAAPLAEHLSTYSMYDLEATVSSTAVADAVIAGAATGDRHRVHVKVDTGMGRIGVSPDEAASVIARLERARKVRVAGLWTHLATADEPDLWYALEQLERFAAVVDEIGDAAEYIHAANSSAALRIPESLEYDRSLARIGIGLYGTSSMEGLAEGQGLSPAMKVSSAVTHVKSVEPGTSISYDRQWIAERATRIATVGAGYADGYHRLLTNRGSVGIRGARHAVVGTVCMDMFMVDVGPSAAVTVGDEVVLFGDGGPDVLEVATWADTIPYETLTSVSARVPRLYVG